MKMAYCSIAVYIHALVFVTDQPATEGRCCFRTSFPIQLPRFIQFHFRRRGPIFVVASTLTQDQVTAATNTMLPLMNGPFPEQCQRREDIVDTTIQKCWASSWQEDTMAITYQVLQQRRAEKSLDLCRTCQLKIGFPVWS